MIVLARVAAMVAAASGVVRPSLADPPARPPNVLLVVTDDQGYGDLGFHGNPRIQTPRLDALARESVRLTQFHVAPVCSPTRASLMTGRYNYRTGVVDTFRGRSLMRTEEATLAEMLRSAGYRTGIFGKWHLGDNAPMRPIDQGFDESLVHRGGGLGQVSDVPGGGGYFSPTLMHNGVEQPFEGYCTSVFTDAAIRFIEADRTRPFFAYVAYNAPHEPLEVPLATLQRYRPEAPTSTTPEATAKEATDRVYAMVTEVDTNLGRILDRLDALHLTRETLVIFLTDNGPQHFRYNAGMKGRKGTVYEGGTRVPCFIRWPGRLEAGREVGEVTAVIDLAPTVIAACGVAKPDGVAFDGRDLMPLLEGKPNDWPERTLHTQWHRGAVPDELRAFSVRGPRFKLVQASGVEGQPLPKPLPFELYDMIADPGETVNLAQKHPEIVASLLREHQAWFHDVARPENVQPPRIQLGTSAENPARLTRQDWRGEQIEWEPGDLGGWDVDIVEPGLYDVSVVFVAGVRGEVGLEVGEVMERRVVPEKARVCEFAGVNLARGPVRLRAWVERPMGTVGAYQVVVRRRP
jgi:arylsulfatase/arylsulfatase A